MSGATQMLAAIAHPPHLAGICPVVTASNYHENWTYQGGAFEQWFNESWTSGLAQDTFNRQVQKQTNAITGVMRQLPLTSYPLFNVTGSRNRTDRISSALLSRLVRASLLRRLLEADGRLRITTPISPSRALHMAAWYDIFQGGSLRNYHGHQSPWRNEAARRAASACDIGGHAGKRQKNWRCGLRSCGRRLNEDDVILAWYDYLFKGVKNRICRQARKDLRDGRERVA